MEQEIAAMKEAERARVEESHMIARMTSSTEKQLLKFEFVHLERIVMGAAGDDKTIVELDPETKEIKGNQD